MVRKAIGKKDIEKMKKIGADFSDRAQLGWLEVQTDDAIVTVHRAALHPCSDGKRAYCPASHGNILCRHY
ncbi:hypothetical protein [Klebsiella quasipneumoniae]|uniref:hypothetical protein n=1 Tax=Klebsiella quasipneumoniae TaxID=1463165 RepID=UPI003D663A31